MTELGLAVGIGASVFFFLVDSAFTSSTHPVTIASCKDNDGVDMVTLQVLEVVTLIDNPVSNYIHITPHHRVM